MSENYCPSCGLQKSYGRTLAYYPDGPDLNKNICSKCGQTLISADATIATLQRELEALRKKLSAEEEDHAQLQARCYEGFASASDGIFDAFAGLRATIATLQAQVAQLRAALETLVPSAEAVDKAWHYEASQGDGIMEEHAPVDEAIVLALNDARVALAQTPTESLERWNAMARVCEVAKEVREICHNVVGKTPEEEASNRAINRHSKYPTPNTHRNICAALRDKLDAALAALRSLDTKAGG